MLLDGGLEAGKAVIVDGAKIAAHDQVVVPGDPQTLQVGKRKFARIVS